jgi:hypothetical protein
MSSIDNSCYTPCLNPTLSPSTSAVGWYKFQNNLLNSITSGSPLGTLSYTNTGGALSYTTAGIGPNSYAVNINGYLSTTTNVPIIGTNVFSVSVSFQSNENLSTGGWRWLVAIGTSDLNIGTNGNQVRKRKKKTKEKKTKY